MRDANWTKWSSIAEIVSSVAILITLIYLAIQTQQSADAINSQTRQSLIASAQFEQSIWIEHPELTALIIDNSVEMTLEQKVQLDSLMLLALSRREFAFQEYQAGVLDESIWADEKEIIRLLLGTERTRSWWNSIGQYGWGQEFVDVIQETIVGQPLHSYWIGLKNLEA
jgi:flagellar biosynthesis component FlhA